MTDQCPYPGCTIEGHGADSKPRHYAPGWEWNGDPTTNLQEAADVTPDIIAIAAECAEAAYGLGNDFRIDWERAFWMLETQHGWSLDEWDSPADRKIRREVNKLRRSVGLTTTSVEE